MRIRETIEKECESCGEPFNARVDQIKVGKGQTCSRSCAAAKASINRLQGGENNNNWKGGNPPNYRKAKRLYRERYPEKFKAHMVVRKVG